MIVCLHCGYAVPRAGLRACPRCGQLLPAGDEPAGSQYTPGDVLRETSGLRDVHPYLWGVESAEREAVHLGRSGVPRALVVVVAVVALALALAAAVLYLTGNADWLPLPQR